MRRLIEREIKKPLVDAILFGELQNGGAATWSRRPSRAPSRPLSTCAWCPPGGAEPLVPEPRRAPREPKPEPVG